MVEITTLSHDHYGHVTQVGGRTTKYGKNEHAIKDSEDFVKRIKDLEVSPSRKLVSYDVTAIFTSISVGDAVAVISRKLEQDTKLQGRCELSIYQIVILVEFCLKATYFVCSGGILQTNHRSIHRFTCVTKCG